jgi:hypothetical protein
VTLFSHNRLGFKKGLPATNHSNLFVRRILDEVIKIDNFDISKKGPDWTRCGQLFIDVILEYVNAANIEKPRTIRLRPSPELADCIEFDRYSFRVFSTLSR